MVETTIPVFLQYGAMGVLALAFIVLLVLFVRSDRRNQKYADALDKIIKELRDAHVAEGIVIDVVRRNTEACSAVAAQLATLAAGQQDQIKITRALERRLAIWACPFRHNNEPSEDSIGA